MTSILNKEFKYVPAASTDIRKTFARIERERRAAEAKKSAAPAPAVHAFRRVAGAKS